jgi:hypothetical protein
MRKEAMKTKTNRLYLMPVLVIFVFLFLILLGGIIWTAARKPLIIKQLIETNISTVVREILPASEYVCLVYNYQSTTQRSYNPGNLINARNILIVLDGTIKLGFNCSNIDVRENGKQLIINMPPIIMLSHEQYPERAKTYDLAGGGILPRSIKPQEVLDLLGDTKLDQEKQLTENEDILKMARDSAETLFRPLIELNPSIRNQYTIIFRW